ncbi:KIR protein [Plasmodium coatneyi]|uniref:KIR protein n=1 Tax=Plasmodium coatneyi TaxID=208452 RepID=A0A1B1DWD6_9APIC|nr:KIR protein [Plasmodium coatneyi]ANQ07064.1 KIR protein [Plasmodium coatneyi]
MTNIHTLGLPSHAAYIIFNDGSNNCSAYQIQTNDAESKLKTALNGHSNLPNEVDKILKAWCYAYSKGGSRNPHAPTCQFFYHWLGDLVWNKGGKNGQKITDSTSFQNVMKNIYEQLGKIKPPPAQDSGWGMGQGGCTNLCTGWTIEKDPFTWAKLVSDYTYDYTKINNDLTTNRSLYCLAYEQYLKAATTAYTSFCEGVSEGSTGNHFRQSVCGTFIRERTGSIDKKYNPKELLDQHCKGILDKRTEDVEVAQVVVSSEGPEGIPSTPGGSSAAIPTAVSSILGVAALPTLGFFLYKYNLLPSWFGNHTSGNGGRRSNNRSTRKNRALRRNSDLFTENDSSTEYGTIYSIPYRMNIFFQMKNEHNNNIFFLDE